MLSASLNKTFSSFFLLRLEKCTKMHISPLGKQEKSNNLELLAKLSISLDLNDVHAIDEKVNVGRQI